MNKKFKLLSSVLVGMASTATVYADVSYPMLRGSDTDRLRGDSRKVGGDFIKVINRENAKETNSRSK